MDALIKSIRELFTSQHRYVVPAYQRPYVWTEGKQWQPLWEDVERVADARLDDDEEHHFLGAIVIRREKTPPGGITEWSVIDGQQRLATLQLLISAMADAARDDGLLKEAQLLERLVHHDPLEAEGDERFKFWPNHRQPRSVPRRRLTIPTTRSTKRGCSFGLGQGTIRTLTRHRRTKLRDAMRRCVRRLPACFSS
jgi:hypothetical protein